MFDSRQSVVEIANSVLSGRLGFLEACRTLLPLLRRAGINDPDIVLPVTADESETGRIPEPDKRHLYSADYLARADADLAWHEEHSMPGLKEVCRLILERYGRADDREPPPAPGS